MEAEEFIEIRQQVAKKEYGVAWEHLGNNEKHSLGIKVAELYHQTKLAKEESTSNKLPVFIVLDANGKPYVDFRYSKAEMARHHFETTNRKIGTLSGTTSAEGDKVVHAVLTYSATEKIMGKTVDADRRPSYSKRQEERRLKKKF